MNILAIETSCDETSVAIVRDGRQVLANSIASQIALHQPLGGVKPELAARQHILAIIPTLEAAMQQAGLDWDGIDAIAVTCGPGLAGALLVGLNAAKALAFARDKPLIAINHLEAHIYSNWIIPATLDTHAPLVAEPLPAPRPTGRAGQALRALGIEPPAVEPEIPAQRPTTGRPQYAPVAPPPISGPDLETVVSSDPTFPLLCLVVSGGHTELILMTGHGQYAMLGKTVDDAAGEAFDKVARILGLPYPGGPAIQQAAATGNSRAIDLPRRTNLRGPYDFSFSGLKTAALRQSQQYGDPITPAEVAAERAAAEQAAAAERARLEAVARAQREAEEAAARTQRAAEEAARREAEETARQAAAEERRQLAARRAEEERIRAEEDRIRRAEQERLQIAEERQRLETERQRLEAARTRAADREPPPQHDAPSGRDNPPPRDSATPPASSRLRRAPDAPDRPALSILGDARAPVDPVPSPPANPPRQWGRPARPADPDDGEEQPRPRPGSTTGRGTSGLIRITPTDSDSGPTGDDAARRASAPTEALNPRVLGKGEHEVIPPPPFLAERGGGTAPTPLPRNRTAPPDADVPDFLRNRAGGTPPPAAPATSQGPPAAPAPPRKPPAVTPPAAPRRPPLRSLLEDLAEDEAESPPPPTIRRSTPPSAEDQAPRPVAKPPQPAARPPVPPVKPPPPPREIRAVPKSGGSLRDDGEDAGEEAADETPQPRGGRSREDLIRDIFADDEDLGSDDDPPPKPRGGRSLGLDSTRPPTARVPVPSADDPPADPATSRRPRPPADKPRLPVADFAASFQDAAIEMLVDRTVSAASAYKVHTVLVAGGVAANLRLRERLRERLGPAVQLRYPPPVLCTDNAAMVAAAAYFRYAAGLQSDWTLDIDPNARYVK